ncbi:hypothetical protein P3342_005272 [Pyrenophora teres f. teres]|nr:hypothetical protein P3342_005272 [Pyrenophora teres f. teres]
MSYRSDSQYYQRPRHDSHYTVRDTDAYAYSRHERSLAEAREELADMRHSNPYASSYTSHNAYEPRTSPSRRPAPQSYRNHTRKPTWPPSPCVEDETEALAKEATSKAGSPRQDEGEPPVNTRGTVDQESILDEIEQPKSVHDDDRRFVLVSESSTDDDAAARSRRHRERRRKSLADRGHMPHINTRVADPPVVIERERTPYGYSKPQKETIAPSPTDYLRSPEPMTPPTTTATAATSRDQTRTATAEIHPGTIVPEIRGPRRAAAAATTPTPRLGRPRRSMFSTPTPRRTAATTSGPSESQLATASSRAISKRRILGQICATPTNGLDRHGATLTSVLSRRYVRAIRRLRQGTIHMLSRRVLHLLLNSGTRKTRPVPVDTTYTNSPRPVSRPSSPAQQTLPPRLPTRPRDSPPLSRPSSRGGPRPASPLSSSSRFQPHPPSHGGVSISDADRHSTYPPVPVTDRSRPPSRYDRYDTMPVPRPRIDVQSPSPARQSTTDSLPYPIDDQLIDVVMPPEEKFQFDHSTVASPRQDYINTPRVLSPVVPSSPYIRDEPPRPPRHDDEWIEEPERTRRTRSNSVRSQGGRRDRPSRGATLVDKPLPTCPRGVLSGPYDDWYSLQGYKGFNICPSCYDSVFAGTPFEVDFAQIWLNDWSSKRVCDFSSPWSRLAMMLTIKQRRKSLDLIYTLADIMEYQARPCPGDHEAGPDEGVSWYGIPDQRDGIHVANFAICSSDRRMIEALLPTLRGYFTKIPRAYSHTLSRYTCSLRTNSHRFVKYMDLLVELDAEARASGRAPNINRFIELARNNAFKGECNGDKTSFRKPWHFIPSLPEFTVCEECYDEAIWPALQSKSLPSTIPRMFNKSIQLVPGEDPDVGSSCCLWSPRMRKVWETAVKYEDYSYLKDQARERKKAHAKYVRNKKAIAEWVGDAPKGSSKWEKANEELRELKKRWYTYE